MAALLKQHKRSDGLPRVALVPNRVQATTSLGRALPDALSGMGLPVLPAISQRALIAQAVFDGQTVHEAQATSPSAMEFGASGRGSRGTFMTKKHADKMKALMLEAEEAREAAGVPEAESLKSPEIKASKSQEVKKSRRAKGRPPKNQISQKLTLHIPLETSQALDRAWIELRGLMPEVPRSQLTRSAITAVALEAAIKELHAKGEKSQLAQKIKRAGG